MERPPWKKTTIALLTPRDAPANSSPRPTSGRMLSVAWQQPCLIRSHGTSWLVKGLQQASPGGRPYLPLQRSPAGPNDVDRARQECTTPSRPTNSPCALRSRVKGGAGSGSRGLIMRAHNTDSNRFHVNNFKLFLTLFSKSFASFHHCTCSLSVSRRYLALDEVYHPLRSAFPNKPTRWRHYVEGIRFRSQVRGYHPL
eukprot:TRINITY_DN6839_c0_g1_i1.p1 TRINITY_DN6839_c0_g1~~TRINITY_DN6839_c0_g1_i1.p1  ORF type:complete len:198 (-),score=7.86 TRINITY_DN6839_c0_g1_i1:213-806(-)